MDKNVTPVLSKNPQNEWKLAEENSYLLNWEAAPKAFLLREQPHTPAEILELRQKPRTLPEAWKLWQEVCEPCQEVLEGPCQELLDCSEARGSYRRNTASFGTEVVMSDLW